MSPCAYPWQQMIIDLTGEVVPCCFWSGYGNTGKPLGNTNVSSVAEIWNGAEYQALRKANATGNLEGHPCHQCMAYAWSNGVYPPFSSPIAWRHESGWCHLVEIPERFAAEAGEALAEAELLEDGKALAQGGAVHDEIRQLGLGRYSVWGRSLYFSSSDNSDPSENGRRYELKLGEKRVEFAGLVADSESGRNILKAREEYVAGSEVMSAKPTMISLISTADCNIDCPGCSQNMVRLVKVQHRKGTVEDLLRYVPSLYQFIWHGGEPYLIKRFREFIDGFRTEDNPNLAFGFTSNGTMLTAKELEKLDKFPRINASISVDSFDKESFEKIRAGADFDKVLPNVLRAVATYDAPRRVFSVGMIVCKSNILELAENLSYAIEHDIGLNLSPVVIYPVTEQLNLFEDFAEQTRGWQEALDAAKGIVGAAVTAKRTAVRRVDATGMLAELQAILDRARERYRDAVPLELLVEDPDDSLPQMARPGIIVYHQQDNEALAYCALGRGPGRYTVRVPRGHSPKDIYWSLEHNLLEPFGRVLDGAFGHDRARLWTLRFEDSPVTTTHVRVPKFVALARPRNIAFAAYGESTPEGLHVHRPEDIVAGYRKRVVDELIDEGRGDLTKRVEAGLRLQINELREEIAAADGRRQQEREEARQRIAVLEADLRRSVDEGAALALRIDRAVAELAAARQAIAGLEADGQGLRDDLAGVRQELAAAQAANAALRDDLARGGRAADRLRGALAAHHGATAGLRLRRLAKRLLGRTFRLAGPYAGGGGLCWIAPLGELADLADDADWQESPLRVLEDGVPLPLPHALHEEIRAQGGGRYSCWHGEVLFSTPDGSDPNRNGRRYTLALAPSAGEADR